MDTISKVEVGAAQFPSKGFILDIVAQGVGVQLPRKDVQRLKIGESIDAVKAEELIEEMLKRIVGRFYENGDQFIADRVKEEFAEFLRFYS